MGKVQSNLWIHVTDSALLHLLMAGMESFKVRRWGRNETTNRGPVEVAGSLWGYVPEATEDYDHFVIQHATTDIVAERSKGKVGFSPAGALAKQHVVSARWPHLALIGDFHTHPYKSYGEATWGASEEDRAWYEQNFYDNVTEASLHTRFRVSLILSIAELQRISDKSRIQPKLTREHVLHWQLGNFRFWLAAYSVDRPTDNDCPPLHLSPREEGWPNVQHAGRDKVYLDVPTIYGTERYFEAGDLK